MGRHWCACLLSPSDTAEDVRVKLTAGPVSGALVVTTAVSAFLWLPPDQIDDFGVYLGVLLGLLSLLLFKIGICAVQTTVSMFLVGATVCMITVDWGAAIDGTPRVWPMMILVMDLGLIVGVGDRVYSVCIGLLFLWLAFDSSEYVARWGLYDSGKFGRDGSAVMCDCTSPPCGRPVSNGILAFWSKSLVFLIDFYLTRRFAENMRRQLAITNSIVAVSEKVTACLAKYDVGMAEELVDRASLPAEMETAYRYLISNLRAYRPFLPDTVLTQTEPEEALEVSSSVVTAPGMGADETSVCICFTDVQSSTALWETTQQGMFEGLALHNSVLRRLAEDCNGYEVKTIGDAFMLAFDSTVNACTFGVRAQERLVEQVWPSELCGVELCRLTANADGSTLWCGLRVRIGLHCGMARTVSNPVTGRMDYFGPPVNVAARVEATLQHGGLTGVTQAVLDALPTGALELLGDPFKHFLGERELKGVRGGVRIHVLLPQQLSGRLRVLEEKVMSPRRRSGTQSAFGCGSDAGSESGGSCYSRNSQASFRAITTLRATTATVAVVRVRSEWWWDKPPAMAESNSRVLLSAIEQAADLTQGIVCTTLSLTSFVVWNAGQTCYQHAQHCAQFARKLMRGGLPLHLGAATTQSRSGNVSTRRRRFATVISPAVELGSELAAHAEGTGHTMMMIGPVADQLQREGVHRSQVWTSSVTGRAAVVWAIQSWVPREEVDCVEETGDKWDGMLVAHDGTEMTQREAMDEAFVQVAGGAHHEVLIKAAGENHMHRDAAAKVAMRHRDGAVVVHTTPVHDVSVFVYLV